MPIPTKIETMREAPLRTLYDFTYIIGIRSAYQRYPEVMQPLPRQPRNIPKPPRATSTLAPETRFAQTPGLRHPYLYSIETIC